MAFVRWSLRNTDFRTRICRARSILHQTRERLQLFLARRIVIGHIRRDGCPPLSPRCPLNVPFPCPVCPYMSGDACRPGADAAPLAGISLFAFAWPARDCLYGYAVAHPAPTMQRSPISRRPSPGSCGSGARRLRTEPPYEHALSSFLSDVPQNPPPHSTSPFQKWERAYPIAF